MAWKTIYEGTSLEEAADAVAASMERKDRLREEYLRSVNKSSESLVSSANKQIGLDGSEDGYPMPDPKEFEGGVPSPRIDALLNAPNDDEL